MSVSARKKLSTVTGTVSVCVDIDSVASLSTSGPCPRAALVHDLYGGRRPMPVHDGRIRPIGPQVEGEGLLPRRRQPIGALSGIARLVGLHVNRERAVVPGSKISVLRPDGIAPERVRLEE